MRPSVRWIRPAARAALDVAIRGAMVGFTAGTCVGAALAGIGLGPTGIFFEGVAGSLVGAASGAVVGAVAGRGAVGDAAVMISAGLLAAFVLGFVIPSAGWWTMPSPTAVATGCAVGLVLAHFLVRAFERKFGKPPEASGGDPAGGER